MYLGIGRTAAACAPPLRGSALGALNIFSVSFTSDLRHVRHVNYFDYHCDSVVLSPLVVCF